MQTEEIVKRIKAAYEDADVHVDDPVGDGHKVFIEVKTSGFKDLNRLKQHQAIMSLFQEELASGKMHAISLSTATK